MLDTGIQAGIAPFTTAPGVDGALVEAYTLYSEPVRRWLAARTRDDDLAEELTHEAFIRLMGELRRGTQIENPKAWLFHAAGNLLMSHYRHAQVVGRHVPEGPAFDTASAEAVVLAQEQMEHLHRVLVRLPAEDRRLLVAAGQGEDGPRLAEQAGISQVALRARLCRARRRLRDQVSRDAGSCLAASGAWN
jgi:RNA polymerase sigma-70 factor, ECF subfamily